MHRRTHYAESTEEEFEVQIAQEEVDRSAIEKVSTSISNKHDAITSCY